MKIIKYILMMTILLLFFTTLFSQITKPGELKSNKSERLRKTNEIPLISLPSFDVQQMLTEDKENEKQIGPMRFAKVFDVDIDIKKNGLEEKLEDGKGTLWRLRIESPGAFSLNFIFNDYKLPEGAELYIYNIEKTHVIGALTEINNNDSKVVPVLPVEGDVAIIEYFEPAEVSFVGSFKLSKIGHDYKGILFDGHFGSSQWCNVDINCPEGDDWHNESHSVCRLFINGSSLCTGSLMNNVNNDGTPYVLTANHCISTTSDANNTVFVFNYESPTCGGIDGSIAQSISNSTLRSTWSTSDFTLVEISSAPPTSYHAYWNGWDNRSDFPDLPVRCIHHPAADVKKISIEYSSVSSTKYYWGITDWTVGTVEHGSSGAPFYNAWRRVVGQVHGGNNIFCTDAETSNYGKFSRSWNGFLFPSTALKTWLDPADNTDELPGLRFIQNATIDANTITSGDIIKLVNVTIASGAVVSIEPRDRFETLGTFEVPVGSTLTIQ